MRASKSTARLHPRNGQPGELHISGAEGLHLLSELPSVARQYIKRALNHPKGKADRVVITAEQVRQRPRIITALPVSTMMSRTPDEGKALAMEILLSLGITRKAAREGFATVTKGGMRGAAVISNIKGTHLEPDRRRGIRVSRIGITASAAQMLSARLSRHRINTDIVRDALILASKVMAHGDIIAEFCISDDPDYTTGYLATRKFGYLRLPHIKKKGGRAGGRAFFVREGSDVTALIGYLETMPVMIGAVSRCIGTRSAHEILDNPHR